MNNLKKTAKIGYLKNYNQRTTIDNKDRLR
jgi:hypothetical protein